MSSPHINAQGSRLNDRAELTSDAEAILAKIGDLRDEVILAWGERGVVLSSYEQDRLHHEIVKTCDLLRNLTLTR